MCMALLCMALRAHAQRAGGEAAGVMGGGRISSDDAVMRNREGNCTANNCAPGCVCLPKWKPTWNMSRSTMLYVDQANGFHNVSEAVQWGVTVYE